MIAKHGLALSPSSTHFRNSAGERGEISAWSSVEPIQAPVHDASEIEPLLTQLAAKGNTGLAVMPDVLTVVNRARITSLATIHRLQCTPTATLLRTAA